VLGNSDIVTLTIHLDTSSITSGATGTFTFSDETTTATGITTSLLTIDTTVHVPDNKFLILSGFIDNSDTKIKAGIPCLGGLPVIGAAFSENSDTFTYDSLVIFLRPHILNSIEDMQRISAEQEQFFLDQQGTPSSRYQFQEGMEYIKTVDDD
jgi:type III secretion protein C